MIAQLLLTAFLALVLVYAWSAHRTVPIIGLLAVFLVVETIVTWFARRASFVLSEKIFAELREDFMRRVLALPLSTVERAGGGQCLCRVLQHLVGPGDVGDAGRDVPQPDPRIGARGEHLVVCHGDGLPFRQKRSTGESWLEAARTSASPLPRRASSRTSAMSPRT